MYPMDAHFCVLHHQSVRCILISYLGRNFMLSCKELQTILLPLLAPAVRN